MDLELEENIYMLHPWEIKDIIDKGWVYKSFGKHIRKIYLSELKFKEEEKNAESDYEKSE